VKIELWPVCNIEVSAGHSSVLLGATRDVAEDNFRRFQKRVTINAPVPLVSHELA
jgi:hypothetical protein